MAIGGALWVLVAVVYTAALAVRARADIGRALLYNLPIALLFLVVLACLCVRAARLGPAQFLREHWAALAVWVVGFGILYLRLVSKSVEVSGHLAWLPFLTVQAWALGLPLWLVGLGLVGTVTTGYLKFAVFQGPSGVPGVVAGLLLALAIAVSERARMNSRRTTRCS